MSSLLTKLQSQSRSINQTIPLGKVIREAIKKCRYDYPQPQFSSSGVEKIEVNADIDTFTMVLTHLIKNAQEATPNNGEVKIHLSSHDDRASIAISDTGSGMSESFIRQRLFKPFETTKSGKGMGIGVFQAREYIHSLQGELSVSSQLNKGSIFNIALPLLEISDY
jgi:signal transduction histidine kinase